MKVEVAVLYSDMKVVRVPWIEKEILRRNDVIAISIPNADGKRRHQSSIRHDFYQLVWTDTDCCLTGHDGDYGFYGLIDRDVVDWRFPFDMPENSIEFEGVYVSAEDYKIAEAIFGDPNGEMF